MQTFTLSQKVRYSCISWRNIILLLTLLAGISASHSVMGQAAYISENITISSSLTGATPTLRTYTGGGTSNPKFDKAVLGGGSFDQATGSLKITAASSRIGVFDSTAVVASAVFYRVFLTNASATALPPFSQLQLNLTSASNSTSTVTYGVTNTSIDLLNQPAVLGGGNYTVEIIYQSAYVVTSNDSTGTHTYSSNIVDPGNANGIGFRATFSVKPPPITPTGGVTTWQGSIDADWTKAGNWTNGVPTSTSDAVVQEKTAGSSIVYPILDQPGYRYAVRNLTLQGDLSSTKALLTVQSAVMRVYGNIRQDAGGLVGTLTGNTGVQDSTRNATLILAGANQIISGALVMTDIIVAGSGTKSVLGTLFPNNTLSFQPSNPSNGVVVQTAVERTVNNVTSIIFSTTGGASVDLRTTGSINAAAGKSETIRSYVRGILLSNRLLQSGVNQTFGNIGLELLPNHNSQTNVNIRRVTGDPLIGPTSSGRVQANAIKRQYEITKDDDSRDNRYSNSASDVIFHYLPSADVQNNNNELNGIKHESYLTMFTTTNNGVPFTPVGGVVDSVRNQLVRLALPSLDNYAITLGDRTNPLPVVLVAFNATRVGSNAQLVWATASEKNNAGFEVQVSADGSYFRKLAFVSSKNGNATNTQNYSYLDTEANKAGVRYYRLRQVDTDGTEDFSPVRVVNFSGAADALATALSAYPNPYNASDAVKLTVQTTSVGAARLRISDLMGREVASQTFTTVSGITEVALDRAASLSAGSYIAQVTLPSGEVKTVRIQKQ
jgi:hypothetical protein